MLFLCAILVSYVVEKLVLVRQKQSLLELLSDLVDHNPLDHQLGPEIKQT